MRNWKLALTSLAVFSAIQLTTAIAQADPINYGTVEVKIFQCPYSDDPGYSESSLSSLTLDSNDSVTYTGTLAGLTGFVDSVKKLHPNWNWSSFVSPTTNTVSTPLSSNMLIPINNNVGGTPTSGVVMTDIFNVGSLTNAQCAGDPNAKRVGIEVMRQS